MIFQNLTRVFVICAKKNIGCQRILKLVQSVALKTWILQSNKLCGSIEMKRWILEENSCSCPQCGDCAEIFADESNLYFDGDDARCSGCGITGNISVVDSVYINWNTEVTHTNKGEG